MRVSRKGPPNLLPATRLLRDWGELEPSDLAAAGSRRRANGLPLVDLATANPQDHGFVFPAAILERALIDGVRASARYTPDARGQLAARDAIAAWHGGVDSSQVILTPGTSLAYFYAFRLLCESGDEVLCPAPTYPLFDDLARLAGVSVRTYHLRRDGAGRWEIDPEEFAFQATSRTRAAVIVSPHNPTGSVPSRAELEALGEVARARGIALIFDEVFQSVLHTVNEAPRPAACGAPLAITLNGFSKMLTLPGLKAGWMVVKGDASEAMRLLSALEYVSDTFLPVNEGVQAAIPSLLRAGAAVAADFAKRHTANMRLLVDAWRAAGFDVAMPEGGLALPIPLHANTDADALAVTLLEEEGILVHPGSFYRFPAPHLVVTIANPDVALHTRAAREIARRI